MCFGFLWYKVSKLQEMNLSIGIVGLPNVGKSTLFNALTKNSVPAENYPFCTIDPSIGIVPVPDDRLGKLSELSHSKKTVPAAVQFVDIAGLVKGAADGEGLGNKFLSHIRETNAIAEVVRIFEDDKVIHVDGGINPLRDIETINTELALADLETVSKRLINIERDVKKGDKTAVFEKGILEKIKMALLTGRLVSDVHLSVEEKAVARTLHFITAKQFLYVLNKKAGGKNLDESPDDERYVALMKFLTEGNRSFVVVDAKIEDELKTFEGEEKETFRKELNAGSDDGIKDLIRVGYEMLGLITYFTTGEDETRAWTIPVNSTAPEAGTAIHTDFKDKFIRAEVVHCVDLLKSGSYAEARGKGLVRIEGKEYIVKDGDVIEFRI
jgi:hypothetical protein